MCFDFGRAADRLLAYQTDRVVRLKHAKVGCLYYGLVLLVLFYVIGVQLLYDNEHFDKRRVSGTPRLSVWHPTVGGCDPGDNTCKSDYSSFTALPYCDVFSGGPAPPARVQHGCMVADRHSLLPNGALGASVLLPTRIERTIERRTCSILAGGNGTCGGPPATVVETGTHYVADIERYSVLISHSYRRDTMSGNNNRVPGFYQECLRRHDEVEKVSTAVFGVRACSGEAMHRPIECLDDSCNFQWPRGGRAPAHASFLQSRRGGRGEAAAPPSGGQTWELLNDGVFALPDGDVFTVAKLLELAGLSSLDNATTLYGQPLREAGVVVDVTVRYGNLYPFTSSFGRGDVRYEYIVSLQPTYQAKNELIVKRSEDGSERVLEDRNGLYFTVRVEGDFGFFSIVNLLLALAEGATLLTVATVMTDKIAVYVLEDADDNFHAKYKEVRRDGLSSEDPEESLHEEPVASSSNDRG